MAEAMSEKRRQLLDCNLPIWNEKLNLQDTLNELREHAILNDHIIDIIESEKTHQMQCYQFIKQLKMRGNGAFDSFYYALIGTNQSNLARLLEEEMNVKTINSELKSTKESPEFDNTRNGVVVKANNNKESSEYSVRRVNSLSSPKQLRQLQNNLLNIPLENVTAKSVETNQQYYKKYDNLKVKETSGILYDLCVECVDNNNASFDLDNFNEEFMYPNFTSPRGLALIINNRYFQTMPERLGTDVDESNFSRLLQQLGYSVTVYRNLCSKEMMSRLQIFSKNPHHATVHSCVVCVLTHGEHGEVYGVDDQPVSVLHMVSMLNAVSCPLLAHKPKLFFIQACRGQRYDHGFRGGVDIADGFFDRWFSCTAPQTNAKVDTDQLAKSPIEADILISYATTPGYVSWRNSMKGSWFIQSICEVFSKRAKDTDILAMLTMVNKRVAEAFESTSGAYKQIPDHSSRLRRNFYFFPGINQKTH